MVPDVQLFSNVYCLWKVYATTKAMLSLCISCIKMFCVADLCNEKKRTAFSTCTWPIMPCALGGRVSSFSATLACIVSELPLVMGKNDFCCAYGCSNNRKTSSNLQFYRIRRSYLEENYGWGEFDARTLEFVLSTSLVVVSQPIQKPKDMFHRYLVTAIVFPILHKEVETVWRAILPK